MAFALRRFAALPRLAVVPSAAPRAVSVAAPRAAVVSLDLKRSYGAGAPPTLEQIEVRVLSILEKFDRIQDQTKLTPSAHFINDLGLDSLDVVECVMALEEDFNIQMTEEDAESVATVADAVKLVAKWHA